MEPAGSLQQGRILLLHEFYSRSEDSGDFPRGNHLAQFRNIGHPEFAFRLFDRHKFCR